jgi:hypothetical protein
MWNLQTLRPPIELHVALEKKRVLGARPAALVEVQFLS